MSARAPGVARRTEVRPLLLRAAVAAVLPLLAAGCSQGEPELVSLAPPRVTTPIVIQHEQSRVVVPVRAPLSRLTAATESALPRTLWEIEKSGVACIRAARVKLGDRRIKITPDLKCTITGKVTRGPVRLVSAGKARQNRLRLVMPVNAQLGARNVAGFLRETADASAVVTADIDVGVAPDWRPTATVRLAYDWKDPPHIDFLGQRIDLTSKADPRLRAVLDKLERQIARDLAQLDLRRVVDAAWRAGFTDISVNRANPPVWMRVTPVALGYGGHRVTGKDLELTLALAAKVEGFVGDRPDRPVPTSLPPPSRMGSATGLQLSLPVVADYRELEPIVLKALTKLNAKGIDLPSVGRVEARFHQATIYPTEGGRVAVGIEADVRRAGSSRRPLRGVVWLSAVPVNAPGATRIEWQDLKLEARTDRGSVNLLLELFRSRLVGEEVRQALALNLQGDYDKLLVKARAAIAQKQIGDVRLAATIDEVTHGQLVVAGQGLFLPVTARGAAVLRYAPELRVARPAQARAGRP